MCCGGLGYSVTPPPAPNSSSNSPSDHVETVENSDSSPLKGSSGSSRVSPIFGNVARRFYYLLRSASFFLRSSSCFLLVCVANQLDEDSNDKIY